MWASHFHVQAAQWTEHCSSNLEFPQSNCCRDKPSITVYYTIWKALKTKHWAVVHVSTTFDIELEGNHPKMCFLLSLPQLRDYYESWPMNSPPKKCEASTVQPPSKGKQIITSAASKEKLHFTPHFLVLIFSIGCRLCSIDSYTTTTYTTI